MSGFRDLITEIRRLFERLWAEKYRQVITGRYVSDTTRQLTEAQWNGTKMYARSGPTTRDHIVVNGCISSSDVWVWIVRKPDGEWYYDGPVVSKSGPALGANLNSAVMAPIAGEAAPIIIGGKQFRPGLATASSTGGLYVKIAPFWYVYRGQAMYFGGDPAYDLSGSVPGSGLQRWAAIVFDMATATLSTLDGSTQSTDAPLLESDIASIDTRGYLTLGAFQLAYGQTNAFASKSTMVDIRPHFDGGGADMVGATAGADGEAGDVPQPLAGDDDKFLRGDATWQDIFYQYIYGPSGTPVTQRNILQFNTGAHIIPTVGEFAGRTTVTFGLISGSVKALANYQIVKKAGTPAAEEHHLNFLDSNNAIVTLSDDAGNSSTNVRISVAQPPVLHGGRLSLSSTLPIPLSDITAAGTLYYLPHENALVSLWDSVNSEYKIVDFSGGTVSLTLPTAGAVVLFDVFGYLNSGALALETLVWSSSGYGTSARATALTWQNGLLCKSGDPTRRYLGTIVTNGSGQANDSLQNRELWNMFNRVARPVGVKETDASWSYGTSAWRPTNNDVTNRVYVVSGLDGNPVDLKMIQTFSSANGSVYVGLSKNSATPVDFTFAYSSGGAFVTPISVHAENVVAGYNHFTSNEYATNTITFYGSSYAHAILGSVMT